MAYGFEESRARDLYVDTWRAFIDLRERGVARSIGVSNFTPAHIERLVEETAVTPAVNQIEIHPGFAQTETVAWVQRGTIPIPKSADPQRQAENLDAFGFELSDPQMASLARLDRRRRLGGDPETYEEF